MIDSSQRFRVERDPWNDGVSIRFGVSVGGQWRIAKPLVLETLEPGLSAQPMMTVSMSAAQALMDELWLAGLRPTEGTGSAGSLAATERHLSDMRSIAFAWLKANGLLQAPPSRPGFDDAGVPL